jgi:hypothetical protein
MRPASITQPRFPRKAATIGKTALSACFESWPGLETESLAESRGASVKVGEANRHEHEQAPSWHQGPKDRNDLATVLQQHSGHV